MPEQCLEVGSDRPPLCQTTLTPRAITRFTAAARTPDTRAPSPKLRCQQGIHVLGRQTKSGGHPRQRHILPRREVGRQRRRVQQIPQDCAQYQGEIISNASHM